MMGVARPGSRRVLVKAKAQTAQQYCSVKPATKRAWQIRDRAPDQSKLPK